MKNQFFSHLFKSLLLFVLCVSTNGAAFAQEKIVLDDFESGVEKWSVNDKTKTATSPATLIEVIPTAGSDLVKGSRGGGLFAFKTAQSSWASASLRVDGASWAKIGARQLTFYLNAGGNATGVEILIRKTGKGMDEVFRLPWSVRLDVKKWRKVAIPLSDFKSDKDKAPLPSRLDGVYLLQFVMRGNWDARFLTVDQLQIEGDGVPIVSSTPAPKATPTPAPIADNSASVTTVNVDYLQTSGRIRPSANVSIGADVSGESKADASPLQVAALRELKPRYIRLDAGKLSQLLDSSRPAFDFARLKKAVVQARGVGAIPLIVLEPGEWTLDAKGYAAFAAQTARAVNVKGIGPVQNFELATGIGNLSDGAVVSYYNAARSALRKISRSYRVGGITCSSGKTGTLRAILKSAVGLDFLTVQDFGTMAGKPTDEALLKTAADVSRLRAVAAMLDKSRWKNAALYSIANLNATRSGGEDLPADERVVQMVSAAWWASYMANASRVADQVFHNNGSTPEWGLLDEASRAYPAYYAMWLWNTFVPSGSTRVKTEASNGDILTLASNTSTAHNLLLINTTPEDKTAQIGIRGFSVLREARIRLYEDARAQPVLTALPKSPYQTIKLAPYAVAIVQFIEPPKN